MFSRLKMSCQAIFLGCFLQKFYHANIGTYVINYVELSSKIFVFVQANDKKKKKAKNVVD